MTGSPPISLRQRLAALLKPLTIVAGLALFLLGLIALGGMAWKKIRHQDRYVMAFDEIDCSVPPGQSRQDFVDEVRYLADLPSRLPVLEADLAPRLAKAFARHPWVEKVIKVEVSPRRQIQVELRFRTPVLAVPVGKQLRVVDAAGVLLPGNAACAGLPVFRGNVSPIKNREGMPWGDDLIASAAGIAGLLHPHQHRLRLCVVELGPAGIVWRTANGTRVLWGKAQLAGNGTYPTAVKKRRRLLDYCDQYGSLDKPAGKREHDLRVHPQIGPKRRRGD